MFDGWMEETRPVTELQNIVVLTEREGARATAMAAIQSAIRDHFYAADILDRMDFVEAARIVRDTLPTDKRVRSGDLGELFATEYVSQRTGFRVPLKRLRYKDDRNTALRGNDVVAIKRENGRVQVLKLEAKSREALQSEVVREACEALSQDDSRPKPSTLAFIARMLRLDNRDDEAREIEDLQTRAIRNEDITHAIFTFCGNDPVPALRAHAEPAPPISDRRFVGMRIADHQAFVASIFAMFDAAGN